MWNVVLAGWGMTEWMPNGETNLVSWWAGKKVDHRIDKDLMTTILLVF